MTEQIKKRLNELERRVAKLEEQPSRKAVKPRKTRISLPSRIIKLREDGFFSVPKTDREVHQKLIDSEYHCDLNRVSVALL